MKTPKSSLLNKAQTVGLVAIVMATTAIPAFAVEGDVDFTSMIAAVSGAAVIAAFVGMGVVKLGPNFARWAINKVASFF